MNIDVGIIDYGMGNQGSIVNSLRSINYRVSVAKGPDQLKDKDVIILPGVGAFPLAMKNLNQKGFTDYLLQLNGSKPIIGICLGMQLLTDSSTELKTTKGLGIIPGKVQKIENNSWHIGWNRIKIKRNFENLKEFHNKDFYFNHSYEYVGSARYRVADAGKPYLCPAIIKRGSVYGVQFHPEKSQKIGKNLISKLINSSLYA